MFLYLACDDQMYVGDGYCDDMNNHVNCDYDGGDCCLTPIKTDYCSECICHQNNSTITTTALSLGTTTLGDCVNALIGDGFCDDVNNQELCSYDGDDCCLEPVQALYCDVCICHETGLVHTTTAA